MVTEHAILDVQPGRQAEFEADFARARALIEAQSGYLGLKLLKCVESPARYLLLVEWDQLEDHDPGFRESPEYGEWSELLHNYYSPFPVVEHYLEV